MPEKSLDTHILIVDDDPHIRNLVRNVFIKNGHRVTEAENGLKALHILTENDFIMVFMDIQMPVMDGITATKILRCCEQGVCERADKCPVEGYPELDHSRLTRFKGSRTPVIALTGNIKKGDRDQCLGAGMDEYIAKPFNMDKLTSVLSCLKRKAPG